MNNVRLVSYTKGINIDDTLEDLVAYCARVSNPANQDNKDTSRKLLKYLIKHKIKRRKPVE